jgi:hypothetical protein
MVVVEPGKIKKTHVLILGLMRASGLPLRRYERAGRCFYTVPSLGPCETSIVVEMMVGGTRFAENKVMEMVGSGLLRQEVADREYLPVVKIAIGEALELTDLGRREADARQPDWEFAWSDYFHRRGYGHWRRAVGGAD